MLSTGHLKGNKKKPTKNNKQTNNATSFEVITECTYARQGTDDK